MILGSKFLKNGFNRYTCPDCGTTLVVPFTCKSRLCLPCARKRLLGWSINPSNIMNTNLNHYHITFTIPGSLVRILFKNHYKVEQMIKLCADLYRNEMLKILRLNGKEWQMAIEHSFDKNPIECPDCNMLMVNEIIYSYYADYYIKELMKTHTLSGGYFRPRSRDP